MKIFFVVKMETKKALTMLVKIEGVHDSRAFLELRKAEHRNRFLRVYIDGAYNSSRVYELPRLEEDRSHYQASQK